MDEQSAAIFHAVHKEVQQIIAAFPEQECQRFFSSLLFDFIFNPRLDAICKRTDTGYIIGINSGFVDVIFRYFFTVLSHPHVMPQLEERGFENTADEELFGRGFDPFANLEQKTAGLMLFRPFRYPKGQIKQRLAYGMGILAVIFVFLHELGHIVNGHADGIREQFGFETFAESESERQLLPLPTAISHGAEFIADGFASVFSVANGLTSHEVIDAFLPATEDVTGVPYEHTKFYFWSFAINSVLQLLSQQPVPLDAMDVTHPHPKVRLVANEFTVTLLDVINERPDYESILTQYSRGRKAVATIWRMLGIPGHDLDPYENEDNVMRISTILGQESEALARVANVIGRHEMKPLYRSLTRGARVSWEYASRHNVE
jgi:hypothetical protein